MFVAAPYDKLIALNATNGDLLWEYQRKLPEGFGALHNTKRGVALLWRQGLHDRAGCSPRRP